MTSYAVNEISDTSWDACVEVRTVNHKYLDISLSLPSYLRSLEAEAKKCIQKQFSRGRVEVYISVKEEVPVSIKVNSAIAQSLHQIWQKDLKGWVSAPSFSDLMNIERSLIITPQRDITLYTRKLLKILDHTLEDCRKIRKQEGATIQATMNDMAQELSMGLTTIKEYLPEIERIIATQREKLAQLVEITPADENSYTATLIARTSITEEIQRLEEHFRYLHQLITDTDAVGKKLDFLCQEILREINTINAKTPHAPSQQLGIRMKCLVEDLREMARNVE